MNSYFLCRSQYENLGDLIINKMLVDELCRYGNVYIDILNIPEEFSQPLFQNPNTLNPKEELGTFDLKNKKARIKLLRFLKKKHISIITESPGPTFSLKPLNRRSLISIRLWNLLYYIFGVRTVFIGKCCSNLIPNKVKVGDTFVSEYYLRSKESVDYLSTQVPSKKVKYIPDLCFLLKYYVSPSLPKKKIAALDIRLIEGKETYLKNWCRQIVQDLIRQSFEVVVYYQVERDFSIAKDLYDYLSDLGVQFRENIVWYDDMSFYSDKMFVISNRLHSLLLGAIYGAFPICLYNEALSTLKLEHVIKTSFDSGLPILWEKGERPQTPYENLYHTYCEKLNEEVNRNAALCRDIIENIANHNK